MRKIASLVLICAALATLMAAQTKPATQASPEKPSSSSAAGLPSKETVESFLRHMFGYDPNTTVEVLDVRPSKSAGVAEAMVSLKTPQGQQNGIFYIMPDQKFAIMGGDIMPFGADPFLAAREQINTRANGPTRGPAKASVTVVEFSDLECPACKGAQPTVERLMADEPDVKFVFQNFPLEKLHPWAFLAATYADCVGRQDHDAFWKFINSVYQEQDAITALLPTTAGSGEEAMKQGGPAIAKKLQELVAATSANSTKVAACAAEPATAERVKKSIALGTDVDVTGTPTLFINGRKIGNVNGIPYETLKTLVDSAKSAK